MRQEVTWSQFRFCTNWVFVSVVALCQGHSFTRISLQTWVLLSSFHENGMHWNVHLGGNKHMLLGFFWFVLPCDRLECVVDRGFVVKGSIFFYNFSLSGASAAHVSMYQRVKNTLLLTTTKPLYKSNSNFGSSLQYPRVNKIQTLTTVWIRTSYPT